LPGIVGDGVCMYPVGRNQPHRFPTWRECASVDGVLGGIRLVQVGLNHEDAGIGEDLFSVFSDHVAKSQRADGTENDARNEHDERSHNTIVPFSRMCFLCDFIDLLRNSVIEGRIANQHSTADVIAYFQLNLIADTNRYWDRIVCLTYLSKLTAANLQRLKRSEYLLTQRQAIKIDITLT